MESLQLVTSSAASIRATTDKLKRSFNQMFLLFIERVSPKNKNRNSKDLLLPEPAFPAANYLLYDDIGFNPN